MARSTSTSAWGRYRDGHGHVLPRSARGRGTITNTAVIAGNEPETTLTNNTSSASTQINPLVDLAIVKTAAPSPVTAGNQLTYTLTANNNGPSDATGVSIADTLPAGVTYVSASSSQGTVSQANGTVNVNLGSLARQRDGHGHVFATVSPRVRGDDH